MKTSKFETHEQATKAVKRLFAARKEQDIQYLIAVVSIIGGIACAMAEGISILIGHRPGALMAVLGALAIAVVWMGFGKGNRADRKFEKMKDRAERSFTGTRWKTASGREGLVSKVDLEKRRITLDFGSGDKSKYRLKALTFVAGESDTEDTTD